MTVYADYSDDEQILLRRSLQAAAITVSTASLGRNEETVSEGFAAADLVLKSQPKYVSNTLVTSVLAELHSRLQREQVFPDYLKVATAAGALDEAIIELRRVTTLLDAKASPEEAAGYKGWLMDIARATAAAGKEDQGFLGRGGVAVNDTERATLVSIAEILGVDA